MFWGTWYRFILDRLFRLAFASNLPSMSNSTAAVYPLYSSRSFFSYRIYFLVTNYMIILKTLALVKPSITTNTYDFIFSQRSLGSRRSWATSHRSLWSRCIAILRPINMELPTLYLYTCLGCLGLVFFERYFPFFDKQMELGLRSSRYDLGETYLHGVSNYDLVCKHTALVNDLLQNYLRLAWVLLSDQGFDLGNCQLLTNAK